MSAIEYRLCTFFGDEESDPDQYLVMTLQVIDGIEYFRDEVGRYATLDDARDALRAFRQEADHADL